MDTMGDMKQTAYAAIDAEAEALFQLAQTLWEHPELAYKEYEAHRLLTDFLETRGFRVERHYLLETGFRAVYEKDTGPHIVFIAEYDALPEIGHACGHNLIAEVAAAAGIAVKDAMEKYNLKGKVTILGTPAEEGGGGKLHYIKAGFFRDVDAAMMSHPFRMTAIHVPCLALIGLRARYKGKASHAAGAPWEGHNALDAGVMAYQAISCYRQQMRPTWRIHGVFTDGGLAPNIIPERCELSYYLRAPTQKELLELKTRTEQCFQGAATMAACEVTIEESVPLYAELVSNDILSELYRANADALGVALSDEITMSGSTDMGNVSQACPGLQPMFHIGTLAANHSKDFTVATGSREAQRATLDQAKTLAATGLDLLVRPDLADQIRKVFHKDMEKISVE